MEQTIEKPENGGQAMVPVHGVKYLLQQSRVIEELLQEILKPDIHYGKIPGCGPKPILLKPGAEKIMAAFQIRPDLIVEDLSTESEITYRVLARGLSSTGAFLGSGVGECSSGETKYKWRRASKKEFDATAQDNRNIKFPKNGKEELQIKGNSRDQGNTVLKMAKKRAVVDLVLTVTACSDVFQQDLDEIINVETTPTDNENKNRTSEMISDADRKKLFARARNFGWTESQLRDFLFFNDGIESTAEIPKSLFDEILGRLEAGPEGK